MDEEAVADKSTNNTDSNLSRQLRSLVIAISDHYNTTTSNTTSNDFNNNTPRSHVKNTADSSARSSSKKWRKSLNFSDTLLYDEGLPTYYQCDYCDRVFHKPKSYLLHLLWECLRIDRGTDVERQGIIAFVRNRIQFKLKKQNEGSYVQTTDGKLKKLCQMKGYQNISVCRPEKGENYECPLCGLPDLLLEDCYQHLFVRHLFTNASADAVQIMVTIECLIKRHGDKLLKGDDWFTKFECKYACGWKFYSEYEAKKHYIDEAKKGMNGRPADVVCKFCNFKASGGKESLIRHCRERHYGVCPTCERFLFRDDEQASLNHLAHCRPQKAAVKFDCWYSTCRHCRSKPLVLKTEIESHILQFHVEGSTSIRGTGAQSNNILNAAQAARLEYLEQ